MTELSTETLFRNNFDAVYRFVLLRVGHVQTAQDIVSRVFTKVVTHVESFRAQTGATERSWLFAIVRHELIDHYRTQHPTVELDPNTAERSEYKFDDRLDRQIDYQRIQAVFTILTDRQREILLLRYQADLKNKEIAELLGVAERTVSATLSRTIALIKNKLSTSYVS